MGIEIIGGVLVGVVLAAWFILRRARRPPP